MEAEAIRQVDHYLKHGNKAVVYDIIRHYKQQSYILKIRGDNKLACRYSDLAIKLEERIKNYK